MDNNYQEEDKKEKEKKEKLIADINRLNMQKAAKMFAGMKYRVTRNKKGKLVYAKNNNQPKPKRQPAGNKNAVVNKDLGNKIAIKGKRRKNEKSNNRIKQPIVPENNQIEEPIVPVNNQIMQQNPPVNEQNIDANANQDIQMVEIFMPPVFVMERNEQPIEQNNIAEENAGGGEQQVIEAPQNAGGEEVVVQQIIEQPQNAGGEEVVEQPQNAGGEEVVEQQNIEQPQNVGGGEEVVEQPQNVGGEDIAEQIRNAGWEVIEQIQNLVEEQQIAEQQQNAPVQPQNAPVRQEIENLSMNEFNTALYYILKGENKVVSMDEAGDLSLQGVAMRIMLQNRAEEALKNEDLRLAQKARKANMIKDAVRRLDELKKDDDGTKRIDEFLKLDYTVFDKFDDMYLVFSFDRINNAIEQAEYIEREVLPLAEEKKSLSRETHSKVTAMLAAINDYKNYMNLRMMIMADKNYTLAFDEELLNGAADIDEVNERLESYTAERDINNEQLSTIMRYITYKTEMGDNPLFSLHYEFRESTMLERMQAYGYVVEEENNEEEVDEDVERELQNLEAEVANQAQNQIANQDAVNQAPNQIINQEENQNAVAEQGQIPLVPELLNAKRKERLTYLLTGDNAGNAEPELDINNRAELAKEARNIYEQWENMDLEKEFEGTLNSLVDVIKQGYMIPPEIMEILSKGLRPGTSVLAKQANKEVLAAGMYKGGEQEAAMLPVVLADTFMKTDFSVFDSIQDEDIVKNYTEAKSLIDYGFALKDYMEQAINSKTCLISQERVDNFSAVLASLKDYTEYAFRRMDIIRSPYYTLIDMDKALHEQDIKDIRNRMPEEPEADDESALLEFVYNGLELAPYLEKVSNGGFFERAAVYGYKAVDDYKDDNLDVQAEYIREVERIDRERLLFNSVQRVIGSGQDYDEEKNNPEHDENLRKRQELSERAGEIFANLSAEEEADMWVEELLSTDVSVFDGIGKDETLIEKFNDIYKLTSRQISIQKKLDAHKNGEIDLTTEQKQILTGIHNMLSDAQLYIILKLNQIRNPYYKTMHTVEESANENLDREAFNNNYREFETDDAQLEVYIQMTNQLQTSAFFARLSESGKDIKDRYISDAMSAEDNAMNESMGFDHLGRDNNFTAVTYLLDGEEALDNIDKNTFKEGLSRRIERFGKANDAYSKALENNPKIQNALSKAYTKLDDFGYVNYELDASVINGIYPLLKTGDTDEDLKYNMELLMNLGAPEKNTRGAAYKAMVDSFLGVDLSKFDRCDDEYIMENYTEIKSIGVQAETFANEELIDTFDKNGYKISAQKRNNLSVLAQAIKRYVAFMDSRMALMRHPLYVNVFRNADEGKAYDPEQLKARMAEAKAKMSTDAERFVSPEDGRYIDVLVNAFSNVYSQRERDMSMEERLLDKGFEKLAPGEYDEDIEGKEEYQEQISEGNIIKESVDLRTEMVVSNVLKELATEDGTISLEDYKKQTEGGEKRRALAERVRELPDFDGIEPKIIMADLLTDDADIINEFLDMKFNELDNLDDEKLVENYTEIAALCGMENQIAATLTRLREADEKPLASTVAAVEGRLNMLRDLREYVLAKLSVIRNPLYVKHYDTAYLGFNEKREDMEAKINEKGEMLGEAGRAYLRKVTIAKSHPFMAKYTGNGSSTADAYGKQQENDFYKKAEMLGEGENIAHHDEEGRVEGDMPLEADERPEASAPAQIEGILESKSMGEPLKELASMAEMTKTYKKKIFKKEKKTYQVKDQKGKVKDVSRTMRVLDKIVDKPVSESINKDMVPIKEQIKIIMDFLDTEFKHKNDDDFETGLSLILNHFEVLDGICGQYLTGRGNHISGSMEQDIRRKVRRIRHIAEYAYTQTYTSARMSRIYFRQQDFSGRRIPWKNVYYYAEQPITWEQGLVPYNEINKEMKDVIKGVKPPRTRLKTFTEKDNSFDKIEHWMKIFSECKPDEAVALDRDLSIKDMERMEKLISATNMRANQGIPDDSVDFERACTDMMHSYGVTKNRIKKYIDNMKLETDDDKTQKQMLEYVSASLDWQMQIYDAYKDKISDTYDVIKSDSENRTISDVFRSWNKAYMEYAKRKLEETSVMAAPADSGNNPGNNGQNP